MTASEAHAEAVRRIREAKATGQHWLDLGDIEGLDQIPEEIASLSELRQLGLGRQGYDAEKGTWESRGPVFDQSWTELSPLASLNELRFLDLSDRQVSDLSHLSRLAALQSLNVSSTPVSDLSALSGLTGLQSLNLNFTRVSELSAVSGLSGLTSLDVSFTQVGDLSPLSGLTGLQLLFVIRTPVSDLSALSGLAQLRSLYAISTRVSDLSPLSRVAGLQWLHVGLTDVSDLSPLRGLSGLQSLSVIRTRVSDLSALSDLTWLESLDVSYAPVSNWEGIRGHPKLKSLAAFGCDPRSLTAELVESLPSLTVLTVDAVSGVPPELLSEYVYSNCLHSFRAWRDDLRAGEERDQEVKVFVLGNGSAGKTQTCRRLRGEEYDERVPSTHGVQIGSFEILPGGGSGAVRAKLWDFGGQDIYHGTHALFLEGRAIFAIVWSPDVEGKGGYEESGLSLHHYDLVYWLDYVRSLAGEDAALIVIQAKCDQESDRVTAPLPPVSNFKRPLPQITCSAKHGELDELRAALRSATRYLLEVHGSYRLPKSWVKVREALRELKKTEKTISRQRFDDLCRETQGTSVPAALLSYLHRSGELFYRRGLFRDEIVLDQEWAVRAIYAVLDRDGPSQVLRQLGGVFTPELLDGLAWHDQFTREEQETILGMMESCDICFPIEHRHQERIKRYAVPDMLPLESEVAARVEALWRPELPSQKVVLEYEFLHAGILRQFLARIGNLAGPDAAYWQYGCCFFDAQTRSRARIRTETAATPEAPGRGRIIIETCEGNDRELLASLREALTAIRIGRPPKMIGESEASDAAASAAAGGEHRPPKPLEETLEIAPAPTAKPMVYISYAWGGEKEALVDSLESRLQREGYEVKRDNRSQRPGDWISDFEREIGRAARVCVVLSEKYVHSSYCMRELLYIYQSSLGDKEEFLRRIVPLVLDDAKVSRTPDRLSHVRYWRDQLKELKDATEGLDLATLGEATADMTTIQELCLHTEKMLRDVADMLLPRGITDIEKDDFAAVVAVLKDAR